MIGPGENTIVDGGASFAIRYMSASAPQHARRSVSSIARVDSALAIHSRACGASCAFASG